MALKYEGYFSTDKPKKFTKFIQECLSGIQEGRRNAVKEKVREAAIEDKLKEKFLEKLKESEESLLFKLDKEKNLLKASVVFYFFYNPLEGGKPKLIKAKLVFVKTKARIVPKKTKTGVIPKKNVKEKTWLGVIFLYGINSEEELKKLIKADASEDLKHFKTSKDSVIEFFRKFFPNVFKKTEQTDDNELKK